MNANSQIKNLNYLVTTVLKKLGINHPSPEQIRFMNALLSHISVTFFKTSFDQQLTEQEIACLFWAAKGKTTRETAKLLNIKYSTVRSYYIRIKEKLDCRTIAQAVFEAIRYDHIKPIFANENE